MADPVYFLTQRIRAQVIQEMQEAMAKATNPDRDMGTSEQGKLNAQSTHGCCSSCRRCRSGS
jgi:hypothetical protein